MTGPEIFRAELPAVLDAARAGDPNMSVIARHAMRSLAHWDLPIGVKVDDTLVGLLPKKLEGVNRWMSDWRLRSSIRKSWGKHLRDTICRAEKVAAWEGLRQLGRAPHCTVKMTVQLVRLVPSVREFLRDDDSLYSCGKQLYDSLKDVKLIREDRREWLQMLPVVQDVSPIPGTPITLFLLWPAPVAGLLQGADPHVHRQVRTPPPREVRPEDRGTPEGRTVPRVRRRAGARAVDV